MRLSAVALSIALLVSAQQAAAIEISFTRIAEASDHPDWGSGVSFGPPAIDAGQVVFHAVNGSSPFRTGVYRGSGGPVEVIADNTMAIPGSANAFHFFSAPPAISGPNVAFLVNAAGFPTVYASLDGVLTEMAPFESPDPDGSGTLQVLHDRGVSIEGENVAFFAYADGVRGVYTHVAGGIEAIADGTTHVPGGQPLSLDVVHPVLDGGGVAVSGGNELEVGIYVVEQNVARVVADWNTPIPGVPELFTWFDHRTSADSGNVVFQGGGETFSSGIFAELEGELILVAPELLYDPPAIRGDVVAFHGSDGWFRHGIYVLRDGVLYTVIESGEPFDGKTVNGLYFGSGGLGNDELAFTASFTDDSAGVYRAALPEPGVAGSLLAGFAALQALAWCRARRPPSG